MARQKTKDEPFHVIRSAGRSFTSDEWGEYCRMTREDDNKRIRTTFGRYTFNEADICINPTTHEFKVKPGSYGYYIIIKWCDCGNGLWSFGVDYSVGTAGGGFGASYADTKDDGSHQWRMGYASEKECLTAACQSALSRVACAGKENADVKKLRQMVEDYMKSLNRPKVVQLELFA